MAQRSRVVPQGTIKVRKILREIEPGVRYEIGEVMDRAATVVLQDMQAMAPRGPYARLVSLLKKRVAKNELSARIGLITKRDRRHGFYARFHEFGTKGYPPRNIPPLPARPFIAPAFTTNKQWIVRDLREALARVLREAAKGKAWKSAPAQPADDLRDAA